MPIELVKLVRVNALRNAAKYGKANLGSVISAIISAYPGAKNNIQELKKQAETAVKAVNKLTKAQLAAELEKHQITLEQPKSAQPQLKELPNAVQGKVVTRMPPEPSKHLHIGHALSFMINSLYAEKYKGKCILRLEDTNPNVVSKEYADSIIEDVTRYLEIKPSSIVYSSDDMQTYYDHAKNLIDASQAYVCFCPREKMQELRRKMIPCECRTTTSEDNQEHFAEMIKGNYEDKECTLRLAIDMQHQNAVMRDPTIFRISNSHHFKHNQKYHLWPMYDFANVLEDAKQKITHIMRSSEFGEVRVELQNYMRELMNFPDVTTIQYGRFSIIGTTTKGREIRELVKAGKISGWDDPQLATLKSLRKRAILPETIRQLAIEVGLSKTQTNIDWTLIAAINRKYLDSKSNRYFAILNPIKITVENALIQNIELDLHPETKKGGRPFTTGKDFYIEKNDLKNLDKKNLNRLMECLNFTVKGKKLTFHSKDIESFRNSKGKILHWVPADKNIKIQIKQQDGSTKNALAELNINKIELNEVIQFERSGFYRLEKKDPLLFWFCHR